MRHVPSINKVVFLEEYEIPRKEAKEQAEEAETTKTT